jgi:hypothetical protein
VRRQIPRVAVVLLIIAEPPSTVPPDVLLANAEEDVRVVASGDRLAKGVDLADEGTAKRHNSAQASAVPVVVVRVPPNRVVGADLDREETRGAGQTWEMTERLWREGYDAARR